MGHSRKRITADGQVRYAAVYTDMRGRRRNAGTFATKKDADRAWKQAEVRVAEGRGGDPERGRMKFRSYVEDEWFPNHQIEPTTRQSYHYELYRHILPEFGGRRMVDILPAHVRDWVRRLGDEGMQPPSIRYCMTVLSAIFTTALNDQVTFLHPCKGVKMPPIPKKTLTIVTPEQFDLVMDALPDEEMRVLVETDVETGLRWGELSELRVRDVDWKRGVITVSRVVVLLNPKFHPSGGRFLVKQYPKDQEWRRITLSEHMREVLAKYVKGKEPNDLLFPFPGSDPAPHRRPEVLADPDTLGLTEPNDKGRQYRHGTPSGYNAAGCRCRHCRDAMAAYRANRRAKGKDNPRPPRRVDTDGHLPKDWFRQRIWLPALKQANLGFAVRTHDLRHAHASWLLAGGADIQVVKERLGHASILTTQRYLHTLPDADAAAVAAIDAIRGRPANRARLTRVV
jgi:integrase